MKNFKEIAEKCLAGKLSGTFVIQGEKNWHSSTLSRHMIAGHEMPGQYVIGPGVIYNEIGQCESIERIRIIDFIPDEMQKKIEINIPEGKVPIVEQTENGVVITWKEKELTYEDILESMDPKLRILPFATHDSNPINDTFFDKVNTLRKLTNIRNYFGGDKPTNSWVITIDSALKPFAIKSLKPYKETCFIYFDTQEHAEQAIKMLGDELKYLFEPW